MSGPRVFGLPHLSEDAVAAFADGVLSAAAASRAQRHCDECAECADAVRGQRETAMMLRPAQAPPLPSGLLDRLAGLPMSTPLPPPRGGLPTVLGADGTVMFVAHDVHKAHSAHSADSVPELGGQQPDRRQPDRRQPDGRQPDGRQPDGRQPGRQELHGRAQAQPRPAHRRATLPVTVLASAAAVVAAGTFGGHVTTLAAAADRQAPSGAANASGVLTGSQAPARSTSLLGGAASLLPISQPSAARAMSAPDAVSRPGLALDGRLSVTVAPLRRPAHPSSAAVAAGSAQHAVRYTQSSSIGFTAMLAGVPTAAP